MGKVEQIEIRPYARLLTMLGDQLIRNERIALVELIKNAYDADADWVEVRFENFGDNYKKLPNSKIIIKDNGHGMSEDIIRNHWINPGTPEKLKRKKEGKGKTKKGRIMQGEKGIGRFAILKLGNKIDVVTRSKTDKEEHVIGYDFSKYDPDFLGNGGQGKGLFLDDIKISLTNRSPEMIGDGNGYENSGTIIEISNLKSEWNEKKVEDVYSDLKKLQSIFLKEEKPDFEVFIYKDSELQDFRGKHLETLLDLLTEKSVIKIENGHFDADKLEYTFKASDSDEHERISLLDSKNIKDLQYFDRVASNIKERLNKKEISCGSFEFEFYIFDFKHDVPDKFQLNEEEKNIIRDHRIYLYRDGIRVYPYGEQDDDWLQIDTYRGTIRAGHFLSNDQVVGHVDITQEGNGKLKDKTNREGLIDEKHAVEDFITIIKIFLAHIRQKKYAKHRIDIEEDKYRNAYSEEKIGDDFKSLKKYIGSNAEILKILKRIELRQENLMRKIEISETLAGVGLSVEIASHDIKAMMRAIFKSFEKLMKDFESEKEIDRKQILDKMNSIFVALEFVDTQLGDIQLLFSSGRKRKRKINLLEIINKVERIYKTTLEKSGIKFSLISKDADIVVDTIDAVLLQLLLNLFDNSVYWLDKSETKNKEIEIFIDKDNQKMVFSDSGPGVDEDDVPYIFEAFYSGKGDEGRGLGLYIARRLLERYSYSIRLAESKSEKRLAGANFVVNFGSNGSN